MDITELKQACRDALKKPFAIQAYHNGHVPSSAMDAITRDARRVLLQPIDEPIMHDAVLDALTTHEDDTTVWHCLSILAEGLIDHEYETVTITVKPVK